MGGLWHKEEHEKDQGVETTVEEDKVLDGDEYGYHAGAKQA